MKRNVWNKGLTKRTSKIIARIAKKKSDWWKNTNTTKTRKKIGLSSKERIKGGHLHPSWKGGRYSTKRDKYIYIWSPKHPQRTKSGYVLEHRLIMEKLLGRFLKPTEDINHINGIKNDNKIENLRLVSHQNHVEEVVCPKCKFKFYFK